MKFLINSTYVLAGLFSCVFSCQAGAQTGSYQVSGLNSLGQPDTSIGAVVSVREQRVRAFRQHGLVMYNKRPTDPQRWQWLIASVVEEPFYFADTSRIKEAWNMGQEASLAVDTMARNGWAREYSRMRSEFMASPQVTDEQRQRLRFEELRSWVWPARIALKRGEKVDLEWYRRGTLEYAARPQYGAYQSRWLGNFIFSSREFRELGDSVMLGFVQGLKATKNSDLRMFAEGKERLILLRRTPLEMKFNTLAGGVFDLAKLRGKVVLVDFWDTGCSSCIESFSGIKKFYEKYHQDGFEVLTVSLDPQEKRDQVIDIVTKHGLPWQQAHVGGESRDENEYVRRYQIYGVPEMFLFDKQGRLIANGYITKSELESELTTTLLPAPTQAP